MRKKGDLPLTTEEIERAKVYVAQGYSFRRTARELKRSDHSIKKALTASPEVIAEVKAIKAELVDIFDDVALRMVGSITDDDIKKLNAYQRTVSGAIAVDKSRLLKGESTSNISVNVLLNVLDAIRQRRDHTSTDSLPALPENLPTD